MDNFKQARGFLIGVMVTVILSIGGWSFSAMASDISQLKKDVVDLKVVAERLTTIIEMNNRARYYGDEHQK